MKSRAIPACLALTTSCLATSGCKSLTIGPTTEREFIIVHSGQPIRVLENVSVTGQRLDGAGPATVDIGGWIVMSPDHWDAVKRKMGEKP